MNICICVGEKLPVTEGGIITLHRQMFDTGI